MHALYLLPVIQIWRVCGYHECLSLLEFILGLPLVNHRQIVVEVGEHELDLQCPSLDFYGSRLDYSCDLKVLILLQILILQVVLNRHDCLSFEPISGSESHSDLNTCQDAYGPIHRPRHNRPLET